MFSVLSFIYSPLCVFKLSVWLIRDIYTHVIDTKSAPIIIKHLM